MKKTVTLDHDDWEVIEACLRDLHWDHGYPIGWVRDALAEQLED